MFKKIIESYRSFEKITNKIMKFGLTFCFLLSLISCFILVTYFFIPSPFVYYIGITLFKLSLIFAIEFIICGFAADGIKKQLI